MTHLRMLNARGAMPESLSGSYYRLLDNGVPHQMFSELVGIPGIIEGILGLDLDAANHSLSLVPHLPPAWPGVTVRQFPYGKGQLSIELRQSPGHLRAELSTDGVVPLNLEFSPALPAGARPVGVKVQGKYMPFQTEDNGSDLHVAIKLRSVVRTGIDVFYTGGIGVDVPWQPLLEGDISRNLHVLRSSFRNGQFQMVVEGRPDLLYEVRLWTPFQITGATSAKSVTREGEWISLQLAAPKNASKASGRSGYVRWTVVTTPELPAPQSR